MTDQMLAGVGAAVEYIESHLESRLDLDQVAAAAHYSKYHLHRIFSETVGIPVHEYVRRRRLTKAAGKLTGSCAPILDIALDCGYESQRAFTTAFREMYKLSPAEYRRQGNSIHYRCLFHSVVRSQAIYAPLTRSVRRRRKTSRLGWIWSGRLSADIRILPSKDICRICKEASPNGALSCGKTRDRLQEF